MQEHFYLQLRIPIAVEFIVIRPLLRDSTSLNGVFGEIMNKLRFCSKSLLIICYLTCQDLLGFFYY